MLMYVVLDPLVFEKENFENPVYYPQAITFLRGLQANGLLILDPNGQLKNKLIDIIEVLPTKFGQEINILVTEILKTKKKSITCTHNTISAKRTSDVLEIAIMIRDGCKLDALVTSNKRRQELVNRGLSTSNTVFLESYIESDFEKKRIKFSQEMPNMDSLPIDEFEDVIIRIIKFSRWLRFYDKQISKANNIKHFRKGIEYVLEQWEKVGYFTSQEKVTVEIITGHEIHHNYQLEEVERNYQKINSELIGQLKKRFPKYEISLSMKDDTKGIMHARHLQVQVTNVYVDPGFDMFRPNGTLKRLFLKIDNGSSGHFEECHKLPEIVFKLKS